MGSRIAGVSAFGIAGTNAHVVLGDVIADAATGATTSEARGAIAVPFSARSARRRFARSPRATRTCSRAGASRRSRALLDRRDPPHRARSNARCHRRARCRCAASRRCGEFAERRGCTAVARRRHRRRRAAGRVRRPGPGRAVARHGAQLLATRAGFRRGTGASATAAARAFVDWSIVEQLRAHPATATTGSIASTSSSRYWWRWPSPTRHCGASLGHRARRGRRPQHGRGRRRAHRRRARSRPGDAHHLPSQRA